jgi:hypothetical protein
MRGVVRDRDAVAWIDQLAEDIATVQRLLRRGALRKYHEYDSTGLPAGGGGPTGKGGHSDRTASEALRLADRIRSGFLDDRKTVEAIIVRMHRDGRGLRHALESVALITHESPNSGCELCENCDGLAPDVNQFRDVYNRQSPAEGLVKVARCKFHYDFAVRYGEDAKAEITRCHLEHRGRVPHSLIRDHHPEAFARYQNQLSRVTARAGSIPEE